MAARTRKSTLAQFAARTNEPITKAERKIVNPLVFRAIGRTLGSARTFADFEATLTDSEWASYAPLFEGAQARTRKPVSRKAGSTRKAARKTASRTFDCGCTGIRQHLSAINGCGVAAAIKAERANA